MSDIFISYAREDEPRVNYLADELEHLGWTVWTDRDIGASEDFGRAIERAIDAAACVVVVWSRSSVDADYVRDEASRAHEQGKLVPVTFERDVRPPLPFGQLNAARLGSVDFDNPTAGELALLREVAARTGKGPPWLPRGEPTGGRSGARTVTAGRWLLTARFFLVEARYELELHPDGTVSGQGGWAVFSAKDLSGRWSFDRGRGVLQVELSGGIERGIRSMRIPIHGWEDDDTALGKFDGRDARLRRLVW